MKIEGKLIGQDKDMELDDYLDRCSKLTPEERLRKLGELRDFFLKHMTPEGKKAFWESRGVDASDFEV